jgi:hypothetical protein
MSLKVHCFLKHIRPQACRKCEQVVIPFQNIKEKKGFLKWNNFGIIWIYFGIVGIILTSLWNYSLKKTWQPCSEIHLTAV